MESVFDERQISFGGEVTLLTGKQGFPAFDEKHVEPLVVSDVAELEKPMKDAWGFNLACVSQSLGRWLGRGDAMEVDFALYRAPEQGWTLRYSESRRAHDFRQTDDRARGDLHALLLSLTRRLGFGLCIYDEELSVEPLATLDLVVRRAGESAANHRGGVMLAAQELLPFDEARRLAGADADRVKLAPGGFVLFTP